MFYLGQCFSTAVFICSFVRIIEVCYFFVVIPLVILKYKQFNMSLICKKKSFWIHFFFYYLGFLKHFYLSKGSRKGWKVKKHWPRKLVCRSLIEGRYFFLRNRQTETKRETETEIEKSYWPVGGTTTAKRTFQKRVK
jgi:hypothetical protein